MVFNPFVSSCLREAGSHPSQNSLAPARQVDREYWAKPNPELPIAVRAHTAGPLPAWLDPVLTWSCVDLIWGRLKLDLKRLHSRPSVSTKHLFLCHSANTTMWMQKSSMAEAFPAIYIEKSSAATFALNLSWYPIAQLGYLSGSFAHYCNSDPFGNYSQIIRIISSSRGENIK